MNKKLVFIIIGLVFVVIGFTSIIGRLNLQIASIEDVEYLSSIGFTETEDYTPDSESFANEVTGLRLMMNEDSILVFDPQGQVFEVQNFVFTPRLHIYPDSFAYGFDIMPYSADQVFDYQIITNKLVISEDEYNFSNKILNEEIEEFILITSDIINYNFTTLPSNSEYKVEQKEIEDLCESCGLLDAEPVATIGDFDVLKDNGADKIYRYDNAIYIVGDDEIIIELIDPETRNFVGSIHQTADFTKYSIEAKTANVTQNLTFEGTLNNLTFLDEDGQSYVKKIKEELDTHLKEFKRQVG